MELNSLSLAIYILIGAVIIALYYLITKNLVYTPSKKLSLALTGIYTIGVIIITIGIFSFVGCLEKRSAPIIVIYLLLGILTVTAGVIAIDELDDENSKNYLIGVVVCGTTTAIWSIAQMFMPGGSK